MNLENLIDFKIFYLTGDRKIRDSLIKSNLNLARKQVHKLSYEVKKRNNLEDLLQESYYGLIKAVDNFNPFLGNRFSSYAVPIIYGRLLQYNRDSSNFIRVPQSVQTKINDLNKKGTSNITDEEMEKFKSLTSISSIDNQGKIYTV